VTVEVALGECYHRKKMAEFVAELQGDMSRKHQWQSRGELGIGVRGIGDGVKEVLGKCRMQCGGDLAGGVWDVGEV